MGEITYRVRIRGIKDGFAHDQVMAALALLFERPQTEVEKLFRLKKVVLKNGMDLKGAQQYLLALEQRGCACLIEPDKVKPPEAPNAATASDPMASQSATVVMAQRQAAPEPSPADAVKPESPTEPAPKTAGDLSLEVEAFELLRNAAENGVAGSQYDLALAYRDGSGVEQDVNQAIAWARKASARGHQGARNLVRELQTLRK